MRPILIVTVVAIAAASAAVAGNASSRTGTCSAAGMSLTLKAETLPVAVASTRRRVVDAAVSCDYARLARIGHERRSFTFTYGNERSAASYWRAQEARGAQPLAALVKIMRLPATRNEGGAYAWPSAYTEHPTRADWDALVRVGVLSKAQAGAQRTHGNVYYGYRTAIARDGDWQFFVKGD